MGSIKRDAAEVVDWLDAWTGKDVLDNELASLFMGLPTSEGSVVSGVDADGNEWAHMLTISRDNAPCKWVGGAGQVSAGQIADAVRAGGEDVVVHTGPSVPFRPVNSVSPEHSVVRAWAMKYDLDAESGTARPQSDLDLRELLDTVGGIGVLGVGAVVDLPTGTRLVRANSRTWVDQHGDRHVHSDIVKCAVHGIVVKHEGR